ncbi:hypothetical protein GGI11_000647 [Coemansia sp. RSA 2049]|nr:hypothetical protein GGI11_000647 [Coemansia sp. RSA 2049]KAJ2682081.1 hypothetical protein GGH99_004896 [Coemansia sp. RSA 1285]
MQRTVKPETSRSMSSVPYQQSPSLVSLPMLTRPSTSGINGSSLALQSSPSNFKRPRVNSRAAGIGSLFRTKIHSKRNSNGGESASPPMGPFEAQETQEAQEAQEASWGDMGIDYPGEMSPLFTDEGLQRFLGSSPQLSSQLSVGPSSPASSTSPMSLAMTGAVLGASALSGAAASRRTKREIAASVLHNSAGPFRRLRSGPASKTMSFPPAVGEPSLFQQTTTQQPATDEFVVVTSDMCPPASLVSNSVISGVSSSDASSSAVAAAAVAMATASASGSGIGASSLAVASSSTVNGSRGGFGSGSDSAHYPALGTSNRGVTPRLHKPLGSNSNIPLRTRAQTHVSRSTEHLLLRGHTYVESTDSLVRIATPSLSTSSSEASLPLGQIAPSTQSSFLGSQAQIRKKAPSSLHSNTTAYSQNSLQLAQSSIQSSVGAIPTPPRNAYVLSPAPKGTKATMASPHRSPEYSFSSLEDSRRMPHLGQFDALSPYTVDRLNTTAVKASERRRRSSAHRTRRSRANSAASSVHWGLSATSDITLLAESARSGHHTRNLSDTSEMSLGYTSPRNNVQPFDFQIKSAASETFWPPDESPLVSDGEADEYNDEELEQQLEASGFPSSSSANFNFEVGRDNGSAQGSPRRRTRARGSFVTHSADNIEQVSHSGYPRRRYDVTSFMDPSSPLNGESGQPMTLSLLANSTGGRPRARTSVVPEGERGSDRGLFIDDDSETSPHIPDYLDYDGSTLTQQQDWQLMNASSSDNEEQSQNSHPRRRVRKRRVLPKTLFHMPPKNGKVAEIVTDAALFRGSKSSETLLSGLDERSSEAAIRNDSQKSLKRLAAKMGARGAASTIAGTATADSTVGSIMATAACNGAVAETMVAIAVITPEMQMFIDLKVIPRVPESIAMRLRIETLGRLVLYSSGEDRGSWTGLRIACFSLQLGACIERARGLCELSLVNIGLSKIPKSIMRCRGLRRLNMSHNWVTAVPGWLARLGCLEHVVFAGNPLRTVSADLVEMRQRLVTLDLGRSDRWVVLNRHMPPPRKMSEAEKTDILFKRIRATASKRMAACLDAPRLDLTHRQHEASVERAQKLISIYANSLYSTLRQSRNWGHSVALPYPADHNNHWLA